MWEVTRHQPHRGNLVRKFIVSAIAALVAVFFLVLLSTTSVFAAGNVTWTGNNLSYEGHTYTEQKANGTTPPGLANNKQYYLYKEAPGADGTGRSHLLYFSGSSNTTATTAQYVIYNLNGDGQYTTKVSGPETVPVTPKAVSASSTQAAWVGQDLEFDSKTYTGPTIADGTSDPKLPNGVQYYQNKGSPGADGTGVLSIIYFPAGVNASEETSATYVTYKINGDGKIEGQISGSQKTITVVPRSANPNDATSGTSTEDDSATSCAVEGIGWIVCPVSNFLAWGMDRIFDALKAFLMVEPISTQTNSPLYQAWNVIRSVANVAFVIVFLIIIYSQLTNIGISNYGLKKLLPRLIIAAVLVNLSYLICAVAVDISNIAGSGLQEILVAMRENLNGANANQIGSWESVTGFILADASATAVAGGAIGGVVITSGASLGAALILLLPMLLGLILAVLVALLVLAARQALIVLLIIIAPLAFVAYLLPNTEKLFERWRSIFITMLVFFPLFALIFGGSQLAAFLIIQTAHDINVILLAMFVQVAPLVLTPLLVRFSGGIIGRIAGFVNDPKKGIIDRTRNFAKTQSEFMAARNMARRDPVRQRQIFRNFALGWDQMNRSREDRLAAYKETSDARWSSTRQYSNIQQDLRYAQDEKAEGVERAGLRYENARSRNGRVGQIDTRLRQIRQRTENAKSESDLRWENNHNAAVAEQRMRSRVLKQSIETVHSSHDAEFEEFKYGRFGNNAASANMSAMLNQARADSRLVALNAMRKQSAERAITEEFTRDLEANVQRQNGQLLQSYAGGVQGIAGAQRALAAAISAQSNAHEEAVKNAATILSHSNLDDSVITDIGLGRNTATNILLTDEMREAAIKKIAGGANATEIIRMMADLEINTSAANQDFRQTFSETLLGNSAKPKFAGAGILANMKQGIAPPPGVGRLDAYIIETINANKLGGADVLVTQDRDYLTVIRDTIQNNRAALNPTALATMKNAIDMARANPLYAGKIAERKEILDSIYNLL